MMRIAFVGAGDIANLHAAAIEKCEGAELAGIWSTDNAELKEKSAKYGCSIYESDEQLYGDDSVDAVFVLTPLEHHVECAKKALHGGKHVLIEKPVSETPEQIAELIAIAESADRVCMPGHNYIYDPSVVRMHEMIDGGKLGQIVAFHFQYNIAHSEEIASKYPGVIQQIMTHHAYALLYLLGDVESVSAMKATLHYESIPQEDIAMAILKTQCGALAHFTASFAADDHTSDPWTVLIKVIGTDGATRYSYRDWVEYKSAEAHSQVYTAYQSSIDHEVAHFVEACTTGQRMLSTMADAKRAMAIVNAIEESADSGIAVRIH